MTCIVGLVDKPNQRVYVGGDSAGSNYHSISTRLDTKVFKIDGLIFGFTTSFRYGQILRHKMRVPTYEIGEHPDEYMYRLVTEYLNVLTEEQWIRKDEPRPEGGHILIGWNRPLRDGSFEPLLYNVQGDCAYGRVADGYDACGSGCSTAVGALFASKDMDMTPKDRVKQALNAASYHTPFVRAPYKILST